jgi:hypothetical protein
MPVEEFIKVASLKVYIRDTFRFISETPKPSRFQNTFHLIFQTPHYYILSDFSEGPLTVVKLRTFFMQESISFQRRGQKLIWIYSPNYHT